jgi:hypothetical protein
MTQTLSFRDVEKLSAYLDGQLKPSEVARLESRLQTDPQLASALKELRQARGILRQLPQRRAPRNFTLTPKMVGQKPPLPRTYPVFRFASVLATLLLFFTFATNFVAPRMTRTPVPYGIGGGYGSGGGGDAEEPALAMESAPEESAAPAEEPAPAAEDSARAEPTIQPNGVEKSAPGEAYAQEFTPQPDVAPQEQPAPPIGVNLQIILAAIAILSAITALILRYTAIRKWRAKAK